MDVSGRGYDSFEPNPHFYRLKRFLLNKSRFFKYVYSAIDGTQKRSALNREMSHRLEYGDGNQFFIIQSNNLLFLDEDFRTQAWEDTKRYLRGMIEMAEVHNFRFAILLIPPEAQAHYEKHSFHADLYFLENPNTYFNQILKNFSREENISYFDILPTFKANKERSLYFNRDGHLTEEGHELVTRVLFEKLTSEGLLN